MVASNFIDLFRAMRGPVAHDSGCRLAGFGVARAEGVRMPCYGRASATGRCGQQFQFAGVARSYVVARGKRLRAG